MAGYFSWMLFRCFRRQCLRRALSDIGSRDSATSAHIRQMLMWQGALLLSLMVVPFGTGAVFEGAKRLGRDNWSFPFPLFVVSTALVYWCDVALVMEALRIRRNKWARGSLDWLVWITATVLSAWCVWQTLFTVRAYQRLHGLRIDLILTTVGLDTLIFCFDVALIIHAVKSRLTV